MEISNPEYLAGGLQAAAKVVDVETSSMSAEEKKRFESITVRKRSYGSQYGNAAGSQYGNVAAQEPKKDNLKNDLLKLLVGASKGKTNPAGRAVCYNCQKVGHFAKNCSEPPRAKQPRVEANPE